MTTQTAESGEPSKPRGKQSQASEAYINRSIYNYVGMRHPVTWPASLANLFHVDLEACTAIEYDNQCLECRKRPANASPVRKPLTKTEGVFDGK